MCRLYKYCSTTPSKCWHIPLSEWRLCPFLRCHDAKTVSGTPGQQGWEVLWRDIWEAIRKCQMQTLYWRYEKWPWKWLVLDFWSVKWMATRLYISVWLSAPNMRTAWQNESCPLSTFRKNAPHCQPCIQISWLNNEQRTKIQIWSMKQVRQGWNNL